MNDESVRKKFRYPTSFVEFPKRAIEQSIIQCFERQVRKNPKNLAVKYLGTCVTYEELNRAANRLARTLPEGTRIQPMPVALLVEQGITLIVSILAVLKAGLCYAPIDRRQSTALLRKTLVDLRPCAILADNRNLDLAEALSHGSYPVMNAEAMKFALCGDNLDLPISPCTTAYVFYTSGSTGEPKGIIDSHRNVLHNVMRYTNSLGFSHQDRMSLVQHSSFSGTVSTLFGALLNGAAVFPFDLDRDGLASLGPWVQRERITIFHAVPSIFRQLAATGEVFPDLRLIRLEGDKATPRDIEIFQRTFADSCILVNGLGATECGLLRQYFIDKDTKLPGHVVPVGYPVEGISVKVVDESGKELPAGKRGEIVVRSSYLSLGYWRKPDLTDAKFERAESGESTYHTGDMGTMSRDGCLEHLGRVDFQIKIRGNNVHMEEVEHVILELPALAEALVQPYTDRVGERHLVAYLVPQDGSEITVSDIREYLESRISSHMIPTTYVFLEHLPLTGDGKVDRHGLVPSTGMRPLLRTPYVQPETPMESLVADLWAEVLETGAKHIGVLDSFFDLGGESIRATQVVARLSQVIDREMNVSVVFKHPTIRSLIAYLDESMASGNFSRPAVLERSAKPGAGLGPR